MTLPQLKVTMFGAIALVLAGWMALPNAAKANQLVCLATQAETNGNIGGVAGADAMCQAEFGPNFQFARSNTVVYHFTTSPAGVWVKSYFGSSQDCLNWTSNSGQGSQTSTATGNCAANYPVYCCNTNLP